MACCVDVRSVERAFETFLRSLIVSKVIGVTAHPEVFLYLYDSLHEISIIRADPAGSKKLTVGNCPLTVIRME